MMYRRGYLIQINSREKQADRKRKESRKDCMILTKILFKSIIISPKEIMMLWRLREEKRTRKGVVRRARVDIMEGCVEQLSSN